MKNEIIMKLEKDEDYFIFLRENPKWHKLLSRDPDELKNFFDEYKLKRRKRFKDKMDDLSMMITLAKELM